jgi:hypothetical protein
MGRSKKRPILVSTSATRSPTPRFHFHPGVARLHNEGDEVGIVGHLAVDALADDLAAS